VTGTQKAAELGGIIERNWARYEKPCSEHTFDLVLACVERRRRAFDPERSVFAHGDAHEWNTLRASATTFKLIDPDGALAEPAFDLAIPMREWGPTIPPGDLMTLGERRCAMLAAASGVDPAPIWEWSLIQLVSNALLLKQIDVHGAAAASLAMADAWAAGRNWPR
jgi:streptomycin 6-kinase